MNVAIGIGCGVVGWVILIYVGRLARKLWPDEIWEDE